MITTTHKAKREEEDLKLLVKGVCGYTSELPTFPGRLHFTADGMARYHATVGWIVGLAAAGERALAANLARSFMGELRDLAHYDDVPRYPTAPRCRVALGDDGTLHGFSLAFYRAMPEEELAKVRGDDPWEYATRRLGIWEELTRFGNRTNADGSSSYVMHYRHSHNGGLLYHSVVVGEARHWMAHT